MLKVAALHVVNNKEVNNIEVFFWKKISVMNLQSYFYVSFMCLCFIHVYIFTKHLHKLQSSECDVSFLLLYEVKNYETEYLVLMSPHRFIHCTSGELTKLRQMLTSTHRTFKLAQIICCEFMTSKIHLEVWRIRKSICHNSFENTREYMIWGFAWWKSVSSRFAVTPCIISTIAKLRYRFWKEPHRTTRISTVAKWEIWFRENHGSEKNPWSPHGSPWTIFLT